MSFELSASRAPCHWVEELADLALFEKSMPPGCIFDGRVWRFETSETAVAVTRLVLGIMRELPEYAGIGTMQAAIGITLPNMGIAVDDVGVLALCGPRPHESLTVRTTGLVQTTNKNLAALTPLPLQLELWPPHPRRQRLGISLF